MKVKLYMQDWFYNAGLVGFIRILEKYDQDFTVKRNNYIEFDTKDLKNFHEYYFKYFFDMYNVAEKNTKRIEKSFDIIRDNIKVCTDDKEILQQAKDKVKSEKKYIKLVIKGQLDKVKKIDEDIWNQMYEKYNEIDSVQQIEDLAKLDDIQNCLISGISNETINKRITTNLFKNILSKSYFGQNSFLNVLFNKLTYEEQQSKMYDDYIKSIVECDFLNDIVEGKYNFEQIETYINSYIEGLNDKTKDEFAKIYSNIIKKYKNKDIEELKKYISTSLLETCSMCGETRLKTIDYSEGSFLPLAVSSSNMTNFFWNQKAKFPVCDLCNLILFCIPAGITKVTKTEKQNKEYIEKTVLSFVNYDTSINNLIKINNNFADNSKRENASNNPYTEIILNIVEQDKKISTWQLQNIFVIEFDAEYLSYSRMEYFNIKKYVANFLIKYADKTLNNISNYKYKLQVLDYIMKNKDISLIINNRLLDEINNDEIIKKGYDSFLATKIRLDLNLLKEEGFQVEENIEKNNKKLYVLYNTGIDIRETLKSRGEENKLNGFTYKMLNSIKLGNKKEFMDSVIRIHMFMQKDVSPIFLEVMQDSCLDFESIGHAFVSGLISNKFDKNKE